MASVSEAESSPVSNFIPDKLNSSPSPSLESTRSQKDAKMPEFYWMVKPCFVYKDEHKDCESFKARFHQYFVHGTSSDCSQWKKDHDNCLRWENNKDMEALKNLIEGEKSRVKKRLRDHYANDVWEHRTSPPSDWNKELPDAIKKSYKNTLLEQKAQELKEGKETLEKLRGGDPFELAAESRCSIV